MARYYMEFYCRESGGGCGGYILLPINHTGTFKIQFHCPKCGHVHDRGVADGEIVERFDKRIDAKARTVEYQPTLAAWSKEPRTHVLRKAAAKRKRGKGGGSWVETERAAVAYKPSQFLRQAWLDLTGDAVDGGRA